MAKVMGTKIIAAMMVAAACVNCIGISAFADEQGRVPVPSVTEQPVCSAIVESEPVTEGNTNTAVSAAEDEMLPSEDTEVSCTAPEKRHPIKTEETVREVSAAPEMIVGDVNGDGVVNIADVSAVSAQIRGVKALEDLSAADFNGDGVVNVTDLSMISGSVKGVKSIG